MATPIKGPIQLAGKSAAAWTAQNVVLLPRQLGFETNTYRVKLGDGVTAWNALGYWGPSFADITSRPTTLLGYGITDAQPLDPDLTAIAALTGTSTIYYRSAANTWTAVTIGGNLGFSGGTLGSSLGSIATQNATGLTLTDATLPRYSMVRSGVGTWHMGNLTVGGTTNTLAFLWNSTAALELTTAGAATFRNTLSIAGHGTTASGANAFIDPTTGLVSRSTSSLIYKRDIEDLAPEMADALLTLRPIWYRSAIETDRQDWSWWGFAAEELAEIDQRLVQWGYHAEDYDRRHKNARVLRKGATLKPVGVDYARMTVPLLSIVQRLVARVDALEAEVSALKANP